MSTHIFFILSFSAVSSYTISPLEITWEPMPLIHTSKQDATTIEAIGSYFIKQIVCCTHEILGPVLRF